MQKSFSEYVNQQNEEIKNPKLEQAKQKEAGKTIEVILNQFIRKLNVLTCTSKTIFLYFIRKLLIMIHFQKR